MILNPHTVERLAAERGVSERDLSELAMREWREAGRPQPDGIAFLVTSDVSAEALIWWVQKHAPKDWRL